MTEYAATEFLLDEVIQELKSDRILEAYASLIAATRYSVKDSRFERLKSVVNLKYLDHMIKKARKAVIEGDTSSAQHSLLCAEACLKRLDANC